MITFTSKQVFTGSDVLRDELRCFASAIEATGFEFVDVGSNSFKVRAAAEAFEFVVRAALALEPIAAATDARLAHPAARNGQVARCALEEGMDAAAVALAPIRLDHARQQPGWAEFERAMAALGLTNEFVGPVAEAVPLAIAA